MSSEEGTATRNAQKIKKPTGWLGYAELEKVRQEETLRDVLSDKQTDSTPPGLTST